MIVRTIQNCLKLKGYKPLDFAPQKIDTYQKAQKKVQTTKQFKQNISHNSDFLSHNFKQEFY